MRSSLTIVKCACARSCPGCPRFPESDPHNTWNGAIIRGPDGTYHLYDPVYPAGSLSGATAMMHGTATNITGPYTWGKQPNITITPTLPAFDGPKSVVFPDPVTNKTTYSLWLGGGVYLADDPAGPFTKLEGFRFVRSLRSFIPPLSIYDLYYLHGV